jgi:hypothetical protein
MEKNISKKVKINNEREINKMGLLWSIHLVIHMLIWASPPSVHNKKAKNKSTYLSGPLIIPTSNPDSQMLANLIKGDRSSS